MDQLNGTWTWQGYETHRRDYSPLMCGEVRAVAAGLFSGHLHCSNPQGTPNFATWEEAALRVDVLAEMEEWRIANAYRGGHGETGTTEFADGYTVLCICGEDFFIAAYEETGLVDEEGRNQARAMLQHHVAQTAQAERIPA